jgi:hypothetical protein
MKSLIRLLALVCTSALALTACGDGNPVAGSKRADVAPYMGADNGFVVKGWKPGDQQSWTEEIKKRNQNQSEYSRIK